MNPFAATLLAMILIGTADVINKFARQRAVPIGSYLLVQSASYSIIVLVLSLLYSGIKWHASDIQFALLTAIFGFAGVTLMLHSLTQGHASVNYTIFRSSFVISAAAAILLLGESLSPLKLAGILLTCLAIFTFFYEPGRFVAKKRSLLIAVLAMLSAACFQIVLKMSTRVFSSALSFILLMNLFFSIFVIIYNILFSNFKFPKETFVLAPANGILTAFATFFYVTALHKGELSTTVPIIQLSFVITALLAVYFLKERLGIIRVFGILCATTAILCLGFF